MHIKSRQHPRNQKLFFCPKCGLFKEKIDFCVNNQSIHGIGGRCRLCVKNISADYYKKHKKPYSERRGQLLKRSREQKDKLGDLYIKKIIRQSKFKITPERIVLIRCRIAMKRTLKQFKKWRESNESNYINVYREQQ